MAVEGWQSWFMSALHCSKSWADFKLFPESPAKATWCKGDMLATWPSSRPWMLARRSKSLARTSHGAPHAIAAAMLMGRYCVRCFPAKLTPALCRTRSSTEATVWHKPKGGGTCMEELFGSACSSSKVSKTFRFCGWNHAAKCNGVQSAMFKTSGIPGARVLTQALAIARLRTSSWSPQRAAQASGPRPLCFSRGVEKEKSERNSSMLRCFLVRPARTSKRPRYKR